MDNEIRRLERRLRQSGQDVCVVPANELRELLEYARINYRRAKAIHDYMVDKVTPWEMENKLPRYIEQMNRHKGMHEMVSSWLNDQSSALEPAENAG